MRFTAIFIIYLLSFVVVEIITIELCNGSCSVNSFLDKTSNCCKPCPPGTYGSNCSSPCPRGHYGYLCIQSCRCAIGMFCSPTTGCVSPSTTSIHCITKSYSNSSPSQIIIVIIVIILTCVAVCMSFYFRFRTREVTMVLRNSLDTDSTA